MVVKQLCSLLGYEGVSIGTVFALVTIKLSIELPLRLETSRAFMSRVTVLRKHAAPLEVNSRTSRLATFDASIEVMASADDVLDGSPLKAPAIEIVDLLSDAGSAPEEPIATEEVGEEDDSSADARDEEWSMYEDALEGAVDDGPIKDCKYWLYPLNTFSW